MNSAIWGITEYRGRSGLEQLEAEWKRLYLAMPNRARYHSYEAHLAYVTHLCAEPDKTRYLALTDGQAVRAICPLEAGYASVLGRTVRTWSLPWHSHWQVTDVIAAEDETRRALVPAVIEFLRRNAERRWLLRLGPLPEGSVLWDALDRLGPTVRCCDSSRSAHFFDCTVPYSELLARVPKRFRRSLRSGHHRLQELAGARLVAAPTDGDMESELDVFLLVEASGWKGHSGTGSAIRLHPGLAGFYRHLATAPLGGEDRCEINSLYVETRCVASQFCVRTGGDYAVLKIGYDETFADVRPGQLLLDTTLERCCSDERIKRLDLCSDSEWHQVWRPEEARMQIAHVAIGRFAGRPTVSYLSFRYGPARRIVRRLRRSARSRAPAASTSNNGVSGRGS